MIVSTNERKRTSIMIVSRNERNQTSVMIVSRNERKQTSVIIVSRNERKRTSVMIVLTNELKTQVSNGFMSEQRTTDGLYRRTNLYADVRATNCARPSCTIQQVVYVRPV